MKEVEREILLSFWKVHIVHHADKEPVEDRGWLRCKTDPGRGRRARKEYSLTRDGRKVLAGMRMRAASSPLLLGFVLLALGILSGSRAFAGPPFATDDPEPVEHQHWEVYLASQHIHEAGDWSGNLPMIEVNYGAIPEVQIHLIAPLAYDAPPGGGRHYGYGDTELGVKYRFVKETSQLPQIGVFPLVEIPTGDAQRGLGSGHTQVFLPLWIQKSWGEERRPWTVYGGAGYHVNPGPENRDWGFFGGVLQRQVREDLLLGGEVYHETPQEAGGGSDTAFNLGAVYDLNEHHHLLFSGGRSLSGPVEFQAYAAYQLTFSSGR